MMGDSIQFFPNYLTDNRFIEWFSTFAKIFSKSLIDHRLVTITGLVRSFAKNLNNIRIDIHCNSGFTLGGYNLTSFCIFKIIFLLHIVSFPYAWPFWLKSSEGYPIYMNKQQQQFDQQHLFQGLHIAVHLQQHVLSRSWQRGHRGPLQHRRNVFHAF